MGIRNNYALCLDCKEKKCNKCEYGFDSYLFGITFEYKNKEELIEHIRKQKCPCCKSENWYLTDSSSI